MRAFDFLKCHNVHDLLVVFLYFFQQLQYLSNVCKRFNDVSIEFKSNDIAHNIFFYAHAHELVFPVIGLRSQFTATQSPHHYSASRIPF